MSGPIDRRALCILLALCVSQLACAGGVQVDPLDRALRGSARLKTPCRFRRATCYGVATLTGAFRVVSGMHFLTDVLAGAALGSLCGLLPPLLHAADRETGSNSRGMSLEVGAAGVLVRFAY